jgi:hypothetical protein
MPDHDGRLERDDPADAEDDRARSRRLDRGAKRAGTTIGEIRDFDHATGATATDEHTRTFRARKRRHIGPCRGCRGDGRIGVRKCRDRNHPDHPTRSTHERKASLKQQMKDYDRGHYFHGEEVQGKPSATARTVDENRQ